MFATQLELTIFQFPHVDSIRVGLDGDCEAFGRFAQVGEWVVLRRAG